MADYTIGYGDDVIDGTPGADTVTGNTGDNDQIDLGGGDDVATIDQIAYFEFVETYPEQYDYFFNYLDPGFQGVLEGGAGRDTLNLGIRLDPGGDADDVDGFLSLRDANLSGFEVLNVGWETEISIAQLAGFDEIGGTLAYFRLFGAGGALDLQATMATGEANTYDARHLTSALYFTGSASRDIILDSPFSDQVGGGGGSDIFHYGSGVDYFAGGAGIDRVVIDRTGGTAFSFVVVGGVATLDNGSRFVEIESVSITGSAFTDDLSGGSQGDELIGSSGADVLHGLGGSDYLYGGHRTSYYDSTSDPTVDELHGGDSGDFISTSGNDLAFGDAGDDHLQGSFGNNILHGGAGADLIAVSNDDQAYGDEGDDQLRGAGTNSKLYGGAGNDEVYVDVSAAASSRNDLYGEEGNDRLHGYAAQERLDGGRGADEMQGGRGNDTYVVDQHGDVVIEAANEGIDTVEIRYSYILGANLENLLLTGTADANGWGNAAGNVLTGNEGNNRLNGLGGGDTLTGGKGDDVYVVNHVFDEVVESNAQGSDTVLSSVDYWLGTGVEHLTLLGSSDRSASGTAGANRITGNAGDNLITGMGGADALRGNLGADTFRYLALSDSRQASGLDRIDDFDRAEGDLVDLIAIDADEGQILDQKFDELIAEGTAFSSAGQYRFSAVTGGFLAEFNVDGDADAEFAIRFLGATAPESSWFFL
ncbi:calcium-binding protein [Mesorhizobium sp. IMUNJ 23232]|uniref:calcium-binding protein n=1 Tax=Mesorhizobium sp. IMUNJ 23232 TaxID=3376064 RepID=UPI003798FF64